MRTSIVATEGCAIGVDCGGDGSGSGVGGGRAPVAGVARVLLPVVFLVSCVSCALFVAMAAGRDAIANCSICVSHKAMPKLTLSPAASASTLVLARTDRPLP
ncbi:hypothetical protein [Lacisediminimonas sp.]|uniref:hypothetical protein n=1 Tax=Lacisediminimonas sp. TaxID=3060582 RepID=UPI002717EEC2|nr:hypothetical protein [Lacisediminimonas sp.]MDO8299442.1 hypothetical protein [Lacisediminimonas sp.]